MLLKQNDHVFEEKHAELDSAFLDGKKSIVDELVVDQVDVLELIGSFLLVRGLVKLLLDRSESKIG